MFCFEKTGHKICIKRNCIFHCDVVKNFWDKFQSRKAAFELQYYFILKSFFVLRLNNNSKLWLFSYLIKNIVVSSCVFIKLFWRLQNFYKIVIIKTIIYKNNGCATFCSRPNCNYNNKRVILFITFIFIFIFVFKIETLLRVLNFLRLKFDQYPSDQF